MLCRDIQRPSLVQRYGVGLHTRHYPSFDSGACTVQQCLLSALQIASVVAFSQTLRRYTSLNHLAQAARAVLQNSGQVSQMLSDLNRVDFGNVQVGSSWQAHCQCDLGFTCAGMWQYTLCVCVCRSKRLGCASVSKG